MIQPQDIRLADYLRSFWKRRIEIVIVVSVVTLGGILYSFSLPRLFRTEAVITPVSSSSGRSADISSLMSSIPSFMTGGRRASGGFDFLVYLKSRTLAIQVVKALNLLSRFVPAGSGDATNWSEEQKLDLAAQRLQQMVHVENDRIFREQIRISVASGDPVFATELVRQYIVELQNFIATNALTQAKRYRFFLEEQLARNKEEVLEIGKQMANFYGQNPVSPMSAKLTVPVALETAEGVRNFRDYEEFKKHFEILQQEGTGETEKGVRSVKDVPHQVYLKYVATQQQILEANYGALAQSHQMAQMDEAKQEPSFQVLTEPIRPLYPFSPNKRRMVAGSFILGCFLSIGYVLYRELNVGRKSRLAAAAKARAKEQMVGAEV